MLLLSYQSTLQTFGRLHFDEKINNGCDTTYNDCPIMDFLYCPIITFNNKRENGKTMSF